MGSILHPSHCYEYTPNIRKKIYLICFNMCLPAILVVNTHVMFPCVIAAILQKHKPQLIPYLILFALLLSFFLQLDQKKHFSTWYLCACDISFTCLCQSSNSVLMLWRMHSMVSIWFLFDANLSALAKLFKSPSKSLSAFVKSFISACQNSSLLYYC